MGEDIAPTLISRYESQVGNTQDKLNVIVSGVDVYNQEVTGDISASLTAACGGTNTSGGKVMVLNDQGGAVMETSENVTGSLRAQEHGHQPIVYGISAYESNSMKSDNPHSGIYEADTTRTLDNNGGNPACNQGGMAVVQQIEDFIDAVNQDAKHQQDLIQSDLGVARTIAPGTHASGPHLTKTLVTGIYDARGNGDGDTSPTITGDHENRVTDYTAVCFSRQQSDEFTENDVTSTQSARQHKDATDLVASSVVRRLTPLECERLQGYPDQWTNIGEWVDSKGKTHKDADSPRYKALGNSIALPFWEWMAKRMAQYLPEGATMASLFDGIGGFPLVFSRAGVTPVWASEIEEFPIAVTKRRFPDG